MKCDLPRIAWVKACDTNPTITIDIYVIKQLLQTAKKSLYSICDPDFS